jgi:acyl-CoA synthetase (AMP-forming)/AMP-acid ligase II
VTVWREVPKALVVAAEGRTVDEAELLAHCQRHLDPEQRPRSVDVVDHLPRNAARPAQPPHTSLR